MLLLISQNRTDGFILYGLIGCLNLHADTFAFQVKEYLANPEAFAAAAAPASGGGGGASEAPKEEAKPAEDEEESDDDMVSPHHERFYRQTQNVIAGFRFVRLVGCYLSCITPKIITSPANKAIFECDRKFDILSRTGL